MKLLKDYSTIIISLAGWLILLSISIWAYLIYKSTIALTILTTLLTSILIFFFNKYILEINKVRKWNKIYEKVSMELNRELNGILTDVAMICGFNSTIVSEGELEEPEIEEISAKQITSKILKSAKQRDLKIAEDWITPLLDGKFGILFINRKEFLKDFQIKYSEYLSAENIIWLIDMQNALKVIDQEISIRVKQIKNKWLRLHSDEDSKKLIESQLVILAEGISYFIKKGQLKYK